LTYGLSTLALWLAAGRPPGAESYFLERVRLWAGARRQ